jgi:PadR family transcriptional regulator PadR
VTAPFRLTTPTRLVLAALLAADGPVWGHRLAATTGLGTGTLYPILGRLEVHGWTTVHTETGPHPGRPARHLHQLTEHGRQQALAHLGPVVRRCDCHQE